MKNEKITNNNELKKTINDFCKNNHLKDNLFEIARRRK